ncbi:MAG: phenylalanine--tRNA ligase subunit beta, partial [Patescibacteria group bacterium]
MKFSFKQLKNFVGIKLKPQALAELLTARSFETTAEKAGNDWILEADILPNRQHDCLSYLGVAAEIAAITGAKLKAPKFSVKEDKKIKIGDFVGVKVDDPFFCPRYTARVVSGVKVGPSPKWLKDALSAMGQKPINNIVDAANYAMFVFGQPSHAFDYDKISGSKKKEIIVRRAKAGESIVTLDNQGFLLDENILVIADNPPAGGEPLAIAGIKGGKKAEINGKTKTIILESANFDGSRVRKASAKIGLKTDSSSRFAAGFDPYLADEAIDYLAFLIQKIAGGKIAKGKIDVFPRKPVLPKISLSAENVNAVLGAELKENEIVKILKSIGCSVNRLNKKAPKGFLVSIPDRRLDLDLEEDLIEEIGRIYGYDKIKAKPILGELIPPKENESLRWENSAKDALVAAGFSEVLNYSFVGGDALKKFNLKTENRAALKNPVSSDKNFLAPSLILNITKNAADNFRFFDEVKIFEINK